MSIFILCVVRTDKMDVFKVINIWHIRLVCVIVYNDRYQEQVHISDFLIITLDILFQLN